MNYTRITFHKLLNSFHSTFVVLNFLQHAVLHPLTLLRLCIILACFKRIEKQHKLLGNENNFIYSRFGILKIKLYFRQKKNKEIISNAICHSSLICIYTGICFAPTFDRRLSVRLSKSSDAFKYPRNSFLTQNIILQGKTLLYIIE